MYTMTAIELGRGKNHVMQEMCINELCMYLYHVYALQRVEKWRCYVLWEEMAINHCLLESYFNPRLKMPPLE